MITSADALRVRYTVLRHLVCDDPQTQRPLEVFLRALYASYLRHLDEPCTADLFCTMLEDGFTGDPAPFDPTWGRYLSERDSGRPLPTTVYLVRRERFEHLILRQIADLHAMTPEELVDIERYMGGRAPSGETWQHSDLATFLYMASSAPVYGLPLKLGQGRERYEWGEVDVVYTEKPEQELTRLEALISTDKPGVTRPDNTTHENHTDVKDELSGEDGEPEGAFGWDVAAEFLWDGQTME